MTEKVMLVTGATDGIGRQTALELARGGAHVFVHGRSEEKVARTCAAIREEVGDARVEGIVAELASFRQVRAMAEALTTRTKRLDVLLNNAGVFMHERVLTEDRLETTLQVNHLSVFLLTEALLPLLERSGPARIVVVSSVAHRNGHLELDDLQLSRGFDGYQAYSNSKLANVLFTFELAERLRETRVTVNCLHPGVIGTKLLREGFKVDGASVEEGAATSVYLATSNEVEGVSGKYFVQRRPAPVAPSANDPTLKKRLWDASLRLITGAG